MRRALILILAIALAVAALSMLFDRNVAAPVTHQAMLSKPPVYAYRGWQNVGVRLNAGDRVDIRAYGAWLYTPDEVHGPEGHARYPAPSFYPVPHVPGGVLIGRIGERGTPFVVGRRTTQIAQQPGMLYLRINDDLLGDNWGKVEVDVEITPASE